MVFHNRKPNSYNISDFSCNLPQTPCVYNYLSDGLTTVDLVELEALYNSADKWLCENFRALPISEKFETLALNSRITSLGIVSQKKGRLGSIRRAR